MPRYIIHHYLTEKITRVHEQVIEYDSPEQEYRDAVYELADSIDSPSLLPIVHESRDRSWDDTVIVAIDGVIRADLRANRNMDYLDTIDHLVRLITQ